MSEAPDRRPVWGKCPGCGHVWIVLYEPLELRVAAKLLARACCPMCGGSKDVRLATRDELRAARPVEASP
jgi:hypothetical protein